MNTGFSIGMMIRSLSAPRGRAQADLPCASLDPERQHGVDAGERKEDREGSHPRDDGGGQRQLQHQRATDLVEWKDLVEAQSGNRPTRRGCAGAKRTGVRRPPRLRSRRRGRLAVARAGGYMPAPSGESSASIARSGTTPTIWYQGSVSASASRPGGGAYRTRRPTALRPPSTRSTNDWLTMTTPGSESASPELNPRPASTRASSASKVVGRDRGGAYPRRDPRRGEIAVGLHLDGALRMRHPRETVGEGHGSDTGLGLQPQPQLFIPLPIACGELFLGELRPRTELVFPVHLHPGGSVLTSVEGNRGAPLLQHLGEDRVGDRHRQRGQGHLYDDDSRTRGGSPRWSAARCWTAADGFPDCLR